MSAHDLKQAALAVNEGSTALVRTFREFHRSPSPEGLARLRAAAAAFLRAEERVRAALAAASQESAGGILGFGSPEAWNWEALHGLAVQRGSWRVEGLAPRHVATVAQLAGQHGLTLRALAPGSYELSPKLSGQRIAATVGTRVRRTA